MTAARATTPENPPQPTAAVAPQRPVPASARLAPGTHVVLKLSGVAGAVQHYEPEWTPYHDTFPVRLSTTGQWRTCLITDVTVVAEAP